MATAPAGEATKAAEADEASAALQALLEEEEDDLAGFQADEAVQQALSTGRDLRQYAEEVENALRAVERESIHDYIKESESLAGLHTQIRECDGVLDTMESMLRGFQGDLASISSQIKYLQDESLSMNVKLRNRKAAETQLSSFITQIVVPPELISNICDAAVDEAYLGYVRELDKKVCQARPHPFLPSGDAPAPPPPKHQTLTPTPTLPPRPSPSHPAHCDAAVDEQGLRARVGQEGPACIVKQIALVQVLPLPLPAATHPFPPTPPYSFPPPIHPPYPTSPSVILRFNSPSWNKQR
jgi:hypothetical protein